MRTVELTRNQAKAAMDEWNKSHTAHADIGREWLDMRAELTAFYNTYSKSRGLEFDRYYLDVHMGLALSEYLRQRDFTLRQAADDGMWRFFSLRVVPDLVARRWPRDTGEHYYSRPTRNWLRSIWWYVYLSWQGDAGSTEKVLGSPNFSTDTILNLEERTGRKGTYVEVYRQIMSIYSRIPADRLKDINARLGGADRHTTLFRAVMKLNTARCLSVEPSLYPGGTKEYVKSLFGEFRKYGVQAE